MTDAQHTQERLPQRIADLETLFTHLQRSVQDLDKVILDQQKQIDGLRNQLSRITSMLDELTEKPSASSDERLPHW